MFFLFQKLFSELQCLWCLEQILICDMKHKVTIFEHHNIDNPQDMVFDVVTSLSNRNHFSSVLILSVHANIFSYILHSVKLFSKSYSTPWNQVSKPFSATLEIKMDGNLSILPKIKIKINLTCRDSSSECQTHIVFIHRKDGNMVEGLRRKVFQ